MGGEPADLLSDVRHHGRDRVVVVSRHPHDPRRHCCAEAHREHRPEHERHLAEEVPGVTLTDDALDPVDELDRLDATLEHGEQRALAALMDRVLARCEADIRRRSGELLPLGRVESRKQRNPTDLLSRHHVLPTPSRRKSRCGP